MNPLKESGFKINASPVPVLKSFVLIFFQVGLLLLSKVVESNPEPFKPHYGQLLQLFGSVLQDVNNTPALYYCILTFTAITAYTGTEEMVSCVWLDHNAN